MHVSPHVAYHDIGTNQLFNGGTLQEIINVYDIIAWHICVHLTQATQLEGSGV